MSGIVQAKICECCGHVVPPERLHVGGPIQTRIYELIAHRREIGTSEIIGIVYADDPNGGPNSAAKCVHVHINSINNIIRRHGMAIKSTMGRGAVYKLLPI
jgi:hypothetical protein